MLTPGPTITPPPSQTLSPTLIGLAAPTWPGAPRAPPDGSGSGTGRSGRPARRRRVAGVEVPSEHERPQVVGGQLGIIGNIQLTGEHPVALAAPVRRSRGLVAHGTTVPSSSASPADPPRWGWPLARRVRRRRSEPAAPCTAGSLGMVKGGCCGEPTRAAQVPAAARGRRRRVVAVQPSMAAAPPSKPTTRPTRSVASLSTPGPKVAGSVPAAALAARSVARLLSNSDWYSALRWAACPCSTDASLPACLRSWRLRCSSDWFRQRYGARYRV